MGDHNIEEPEDGEQDFGIASIDLHRDFNVGPFLNNDIAIATLGYLDRRQRSNFFSSGGIQFGEYVGAACLPSEQYRYVFTVILCYTVTQFKLSQLLIYCHLLFIVIFI